MINKKACALFFILAMVCSQANAQTGNFGVGISTPLEKLDIDGALRIGNTVNTNNGTIRYTGADFEGRKAGVWVSLTGGGGGSQWTTSGNNILNTNTGNVGIDTAAPPFKLTIGGDGGIMATGVFGSGAPLTASGDNSRLIWYPRKGAFRAGNVDGGDEWDDVNIGDYSFAGGYNTQASDEGAVAIGYSAKATARSGVALGFFPLAGGEGSVALGAFAEATGSFSTAIGLFSCACGENSTSIGQSVTSSGDNSMAAGTYANTNFKDGAFALGDHSTTDDLLSSADNEFSSRFDGGYRWFSDAATTEANGLFLKAGNVGIGTTGPSTHLHVAGKGDQEISLESTTALTDGAEYPGRRWSLQSNPGGDIQATFQIIDREAGQSRLAINNNGNVGLGTTEPEARLDVIGTTKTTSLQVTTGAGEGYILKSDVDGHANWVAPSSLGIGTWIANGNNQYSSLSGNVGIGTTSPGTHLHVAGKGDQEISLESTTALTDGAEYPGRRWSLQSNPGGDIQATFQIIDREAGQARLAINNNGNVGLGTTEPEARLDVIGTTKTTSLQATTAITTGGLTVGLTRLTVPTALDLDETHYTIVAAASGCSVNFPDASTCAGRVYVLFNTSAGLLFTDLNTPNDVIAANGKIQMISDGVNWLRLN